MGDEICLGNKEIIAYFQQLRLIASTTSYKDALVTLYRWKKRYGLSKLMHRQPNGKPYLIKDEIRLWLARTDELGRPSVKKEKVTK